MIIQLFKYAVCRLLVLELHTYGVALLTRAVFGYTCYGAIGNIYKLPRRGTQHRCSQAKLFDHTRSLRRFDPYEVPNAVLSFEQYKEPSDNISKQVLCPKAYNCGQDGSTRNSW